MGREMNGGRRGVKEVDGYVTSPINLCRVAMARAVLHSQPDDYASRLPTTLP